MFNLYYKKLYDKIIGCMIYSTLKSIVACTVVAVKVSEMSRYTRVVSGFRLDKHFSAATETKATMA
jgi:hypothetical protein